MKKTTRVEGTEDSVVNIIKYIKTEDFGANQLNITFLLLACSSILAPIVQILNECMETSYPIKVE